MWKEKTSWHESMGDQGEGCMLDQNLRLGIPSFE